MLLNFSIIFLRYSHATDSNWPEIEGESTTSGSNSPYGQSNSNKSKRIDAANATRKKKKNKFLWSTHGFIWYSIMDIYKQ